MAPKTCEAVHSAEAGHCEDHSGLLTWLRGIAALLAVTASLLSYSVLWQAPQLRTEIAREIARVDGDVKVVNRDLDNVKSDITDLKSRVTKLERRR